MHQHDAHWLNQIETLCSEASLRHVDLVVDQMAWGLSVLPALRVMHPAMPWFSLFSGTPEETLLEQAPILMRINLDNWQHKAWLEELIEQLSPLPRLIVLITPLPFDELSKALLGLSQLAWGGQSGLLRFYDPRVLPHLFATVLNPAQQQQFLRVALFWSWLDRDQRPAWQPGTCRSNQTLPAAPPAIALTDEQFDRLGCISDAQSLLATVRAAFAALSQEQCFARCYQLVLQASQENYFGDLKVYARLNTERMAKWGVETSHD